MRLTRVLATRLFGIFDHEIPLNLDERITIIHGPNGFGKTIVLRLLAALMSGNYASLRGVSFEEFALEFDTGLRVKVLRQEGSEEDVAQLNVEFRLTEVEERQDDSPCSCCAKFSPRPLPRGESCRTLCVEQYTASLGVA